MEKKVKLLAPTMPNFIRIEQAPGKREDGIKQAYGFSIEELSGNEAIEYAELMKQEFLKHWRNKTSKGIKDAEAIDIKNVYLAMDERDGAIYSASLSKAKIENYCNNQRATVYVKSLELL